MSFYSNNILEEELKNKIAQDYFAAYDNTQILGKIDFAIATKVRDNDLGLLYETEYLYWAEAKKGRSHDICASLVQLIITIGKAKTFNNYLPPKYLGAFDAEKIAFLNYHSIDEIFYQNDFNWNVTPSDHETKEFKQVYELLKSFFDNDLTIFHFEKDEKQLRQFIKKNFVFDGKITNQINITKNNFVAIFNKWVEVVKPTIGVNWDEYNKKYSVVPADFYLADVLSNENQSINDSLKILLKIDVYNLSQKFDGDDFFKEINFKDEQKAHKLFWNRFKRPPREEIWDYLTERRDLLVPADMRERKGAFFTPSKWVDKSQEYLAKTLGENWQDEYFVWDCCAGTGNLLHGLTNKYNIFASTLDDADVKIMKQSGEFLDSHVFQFDFLNDEFTSEKVPAELKRILNDPEKRKKLVIYINPPYAEATTAKTVAGTGENKAGVARGNVIFERYKNEIGKAANEIFAQFFIRIYREIPGAPLAEFSKLKILQAANFADFRNIFQARLEKLFLVPAKTFDNVKGSFPIGFFIWNTTQKEKFESIEADIFERDGKFAGTKKISVEQNQISINKWLKQFDLKEKSNAIGFMGTPSPDFQHCMQGYVSSKPGTEHFTYYGFSNKNLIQGVIYLAVRQCIPATWLNDRDQFLFPRDGWERDFEFQNDCLAFTLFHGQNRIQSKYGVNHWIPFRENEVDARERFESHFMSDFIQGGGASRPTSECANENLSLCGGARRPASLNPDLTLQGGGASRPTLECANNEIPSYGGARRPASLSEIASTTMVGRDAPPPCEGDPASLSGSINPYLNKVQQIDQTRAHLPHWHQEQKLQFVTFRLADALPQEKIKQLQYDKSLFENENPLPWSHEVREEYYKRFGSKIDEWLDEKYGSCVLQFPNVRQVVNDALLYFDNKRYLIHAFVIMPNHVHVLLELLNDNKIADVLQAWKSFTSKKINELIGSTGTLWQGEYFDRLVRDYEHYKRVLNYIEKNPQNLSVGTFTLYKNSLVQERQITLQGGGESRPTSECANNEIPSYGGARRPASLSEIASTTMVGQDAPPPCNFSPEAMEVFDAGRALWRYYHKNADKYAYNANASFYDIRAYFQGFNAKGTMNLTSSDATYNELRQSLSDALKTLAAKIEPKVYEYGFLK